ncbi:MAG: hypothetical protein ACRDQH_18240 [Pseudonocardiaceae bacterium]
MSTASRMVGAPQRVAAQMGSRLGAETPTGLPLVDERQSVRPTAARNADSAIAWSTRGASLDAVLAAAD